MHAGARSERRELPFQSIRYARETAHAAERGKIGGRPTVPSGHVITAADRLGPRASVWTVDKIEEGSATVEIDGAVRLNVPVSLLPAGDSRERRSLGDDRSGSRRA